MTAFFHQSRSLAWAAPVCRGAGCAGAVCAPACSAAAARNRAIAQLAIVFAIRFVHGIAVSSVVFVAREFGNV
jgi:hypothetical protein